MKLRYYQEQGISELNTKFNQGLRTIIYHGATGSGKTVTFAGIIKEAIRNTSEKIVVVVHRERLLFQTATTLNKLGIKAGLLIAESKFICQSVGENIYVPYTAAQVVICMVETLNNRIKNNPDLFGKVKMLIIDEAHYGNFNKIYQYFTNVLTVGFTATPVSAKKSNPLNAYYQDIVSPISIKKLIDENFLAKNISISIKGGVDRSKLIIRGGDFDDKKMGVRFSVPKHVKNTVKAYEQYCMGEKTIIFNCNIEHNHLVSQHFINAGYNCRAFDSSLTKEEQRDILNWYERTDDALICNVAILTTGIDIPSIRNAIINKSTLSLPLWQQMCGRPSRIDEGKTTFKIIDLGYNIQTHCDWHYPHDWIDIFHNPEKAGKAGIAPVKNCVECESFIHASVLICPFCFANNKKESIYDDTTLDLEILTKGIDINAIITRNEMYKPYRSLHLIKAQLVQRFKSKYKHNTITQRSAELINSKYQELVRVWCEKNEKTYNKWHKDITTQWLQDELNKNFEQLENRCI